MHAGARRKPGGHLKRQASLKPDSGRGQGRPAGGRRSGPVCWAPLLGRELGVQGQPESWLGGRALQRQERAWVRPRSRQDPELIPRSPRRRGPKPENDRWPRRGQRTFTRLSGLQGEESLGAPHWDSALNLCPDPRQASQRPGNPFHHSTTQQRKPTGSPSCCLIQTPPIASAAHSTP